MFEHHFGLRENPFAAGHQTRFVYPSHEHQEALAHLRFGIENFEPFVLITGEVGTGKTTALYDVLAEYESRAVVALITNSSLTREELLEEICLRFGLASASTLSKPQAIVALERFLRQARGRGHHAILILDEAQNLERDLLEEIRLLSNLEDQGHKLIQLFLVGQPELEEKLARSELRQLRQRITVFYRLSPLGPEDTERYIHHRISVAGGNAVAVFPPEACREVYAITHGIPREINTVAGQAMLNAYVDDSTVVRPDHVRSVARDNEFTSVLRGGTGAARIAMEELVSRPAEAVGPRRDFGSATGARVPATGGASAPATRPADAPAHAMSTPPVSGPPTPPPTLASEPIAFGPPPLIPAEPGPASPDASTPPSPTPTSVAAGSAPSQAPVAAGPPPLHPAGTFESSPAGVAQAPPGAAAPAPPPATGPQPPVTQAAPPTPRKPGAVAPAGSSEDWGSWLTSLSQLPSALDETLAETLGAAPAKAEPPQPPTAAPAASSPMRPEVAASAPQRMEPTPRTAHPPRTESVTPASAAPRMEAPSRATVPPRARDAAPAAPPPREEYPSAAPVPTHVTPAAPLETESAARTPRRLEFMDEEPGEEGAKTLRWLVFAGVIAVVAVGAVLGIRAWLGAAKSAQSAPASALAPPAETRASTATATVQTEPGTSAGASGSAEVQTTTRAPHGSAPPVPSSSSSAATQQRPPAGNPATGNVTGGSTPQPAEARTQGGAAASGGGATGGGAAAGGAAAGGAAAAGAASGGAAAGGGAAGGAAAGAAAGGGAAGGGAASNAAAPGTSSGSAATGAAPTTASATSHDVYGIAVGTYLDEDRANEESTKLIASTTLPARVVPVTENDVTMYRLVMGSFETRQKAERAASSLIERGLVDEARVVPLSAATASQP